MTTINDRESIKKLTNLLTKNDVFLLECDYVISSYIHYCANNEKVLPNITIDERIFTKLAIKFLGYQRLFVVVR